MSARKQWTILGMEPVRAVVCIFSLISALSFSMYVAPASAGTISEHYYSVFDGDYNGDGRVDLIFVPKPVFIGIPSPQGTLINVTEDPLVFQQSGDGTYLVVYPADLTHMGPGSLVPSNHDMHYGDFNGDGARDILFQSHENGTQTFIAYGDAGASPKRLTYLGMYGVSKAAATLVVKDLQDDGIDDVVFTLNDGTTKFAYGGTSQMELVIDPLADRMPGGEVAPFFEGAFQVDESGAATYSLTVDVPAVPSGMAPDIQIGYSSSGGGGDLGLGWSLAVGSDISRCPTDYREDNFIDGIDFDANDQFCLDGTRLVLVNGTHGANGAEYRLSSDNSSRAFIRSASNGPLIWEVQSPRGAVSLYGVTSDARVTNNQNQVLIWHMSSQINVYGESIEYVYNADKSSGEDYLVEVKYGPDLAHRVNFIYENSGDTAFGYVAGVLRKNVKRLSQLEIYIPDRNERIGSYGFTYQLGISNESLLHQITKCMGAADNCTSTQFFEWDQSGLSFSRQGTSAYYPIANDPNGWASVDVARIMQGDFNGDGIDDLYLQSGDSSSGAPDRIFFFSKSGVATSVPVVGFNPHVTTSDPSWAHVDHGRLKLGDYNGDGKTDFYRINGEYNANHTDQIFYSRGDGSFAAVNVTGWNQAVAGTASLGWSQVDVSRMVQGDFDGDGRTDFYFINGGGSDNPVDYVVFSRGSGLSIATFEVVQASGPNVYVVGNTSWASIDVNRVKVADFNGDGLDDVYYTDGAGNLQDALYFSRGDGSFEFKAVTGFNHYIVGTSSISWSGVDINRTSIADFNGDGLADFYYIDGGSNGADTVAFSRGNGSFDTRVVGGFNVAVSSDPGWANVDVSRLQFADFNGDGRTDIYYMRGDQNNQTADVIAYSKGDGNFYLTAIPVNEFNSNTGTLLAWANVDVQRTKIGDFNGDGASDFYFNGGAGSSGHGVIALGTQNSPSIVSFPDGIENRIQVNYETLAQSSSYTPGSSSDDIDGDGKADQYPIMDVTGTMSVVTSVVRDNGIGGAQITKYKYAGLKSGHKGIGLLGFRKTEAADNNTGISAITYADQNYLKRTEGMVARTETHYVKDGHAKKLNETINTNDVQEIAYGTLFVRMPYLKYQEVKSWDFVTGQLVGTVAAEFSYDELGNLLENTTTTTDPVTGEVFTSVKSTQYYPVQDTPYFAGLVKRIDSSSSVPGTPESGPLTAARSTYFEYNHLGAPIKQVVEPGHAKALTTEFEYNAAGQVTFTRVSAAGLPTKVSETRYYDAGPQKGLEYQKINALGHTTTFYYENADYPWLRTRTVDPNGRISKTYYDSWGRAPTVEAADGTTITQQTFWCDENCEEGEVYYGKATASVGKPTYVFFDKQGREVRKSAYGFDGTNEGRLVHIRTEYNAIGKIARHSEPHFDGDTPQWNQTWYDDLGRPQIAYDSSGNPMTYIHLGREVMSTNALGQSKTVETNAQGQTVRVTDAIGKDIEYAYGPFGELLYTRDSDGVVTRAQYDLFGNKVAMQDPDKGNWTYEYDAYGQLLRQTDARGWVAYHEYDILGRMTKRVDRYGTSSAETSTWEYDLANLGSTGRKALGMLNRSSKGAFIERYQFDNLGRPTVTSTTIDAVVWNSSTTYDAYSRPLMTSYPGGGLVIKNEYHPTLGILQRIKNNSTNAEYWELQETNARGQGSLIQLGNLMVTSNTFNEQTGYLESITSYVPGQATNLQEMSFHFDAIGNLQVREEYQRINGTNQLVTETLSYDNLNRLVQSHVTSPLLSYYNTLTYQDNGNIATKSEVGTYTYGGTCNGIKAGPHAVTQIVGQKNATYCYDQNGNMLSGDSRTITYTPQDVPKKIIKGANSVEFFYGPNQERYKRIDVEGGVTTTTISIGGYERIKSGSDTTYKYYVGGFAVVSKKNSEALKTQYLLKDHQGSVVAAVDSLGTVIERMSFDAWGKRRTVTWEGMADTSLFAYKSAVTNRGYTGHEHVDSMGLIHMNGRVYDPVIGRFLSADPFVQDPTNSQSLNRYSYVMNNPLSMTDPSGFFWKKIKKAFKKVIKAVVKAVKKIVQLHGEALLAWVVPGGRAGLKYMGQQLARTKYGAAVAQAVGCTLTGGIGCIAVVGIISTAMAYGATGDLTSALRAGATAAAVAAASFYLPGLAASSSSVVINSVVNAAIGHVRSSLINGAANAVMGKSFKDGFNNTFKIRNGADYLTSMLVSYLGSMAAQGYLNTVDGLRGSSTLDPYSPSSCQPIEIRTGRKFLIITDLRTGRLSFVRYYNSFASETSSMGGKWRHEFEKKLIISQHSPFVAAVRGDGQALEFNIDTDINSPTKAKGRFNETLKRHGDEWHLTSEDDSVEIYNASGELQSIVQRDGYTQTLQYSNGKLVSISDSDNRRIDLRLDYRGMLVEISSTSGHAVGYRYNVFDALVSVRMPDGTPTHSDNLRVNYLYEDPRFLHALTGMIDEGGKRFGTWEYDEQMRAFYEHTEGQLANHLEYLDGNITNLTDALGRTTTYHFNERGQPALVEGHPTASCIGSNNQYEYDDNGYLKSKTDWNGNRTEFTHSDRGLETSRTEAAGTPEAYTVKTEWHDVYRLPVRIEQPGNTTHYAYDETGQLLRKMIVDTSTAEQSERIWHYSYNAKRQLVRVDGPRIDVPDITRFEYDEQGNQTAVINALQHRMRVLESNADGLSTLLQDQNGTQTRLTYNARGWLTEKATQLENGEWAATTFDYTGIGAYEGTGLIKSITQPNGTRLSYEYNAARQVVALTNNIGERIDYQLDTMGNRVEEITRDTRGQIRREKRAVYDELSRLLQSVGANGNATRFGYDANGNVTDITDALERNTHNAFDALNRLISSVDALDGETQTAYNEQGQVEQVTDARGIVTRYDYNGFGEVTKLTSQDTGVTTYAYDSAGNKVEQRDANGIVTRYRYDALNRLQVVEYPSSPADNIAYQYDVATLNAVGRVAKVQDQTGASERAYDKRGNVVQEVRTIGTAHYSVGYEYDAAGNLTAMTYPNGVTIRYQQDASGRVARISRDTTLGDNTLLDNIHYLPFGPISSLRYGNGLTDQREHDRDYRLQQQRVADLYRKTYEYDPVGNITAILDQQQAANDKHYEYDELNRLTMANTGLSNREQFDYDAAGNRIAYQQVANGDVVQQQAYLYAATSNRLLAVNQGAVQRSFQYDDAGNTVMDSRLDGEQRALQYGANNRLQLVAKDGLPTARYQHNAQGQRVIKVVNGEETHFIYDINDRLIAEASGDGQIQRQYVYLGRVPVAMQDAANDQWYFVHNDHLGTPKLVTDANAQVVWRGEAKAFGETEESGSLKLAFRFPGQVEDGESGYFYNYFRDYDASVGRYLQSDPIGLDGGMNTYGYAEGNSVLKLDRFGLQVVFQGSEADVGAMKGVYNSLRSGSPTAAAMMTRLENSPYTVNIRVGAGNLFSTSSNMPGIVNIVMDPFSKNPLAGTTAPSVAWLPAPTEVLLGHELIHAAHYLENNVGWLEEQKTIGLWPYSGEGETENQIRKEFQATTGASCPARTSVQP